MDEQDELPEATQREAELQRQIDDLQGQVTGSAEKLSQLKSENLTLRDENQALNTASNKKRRFRTQVCPMPTLETPNSGTGANLPTTTLGGEASMREKAKDAQTYDGGGQRVGARTRKKSIRRSKRLPGLAPPIRKSNPDSYADTPFTDEITLMEIPMKFSFPSIKAYDGTPDLDDHVPQYRQRMLAVALPNGSIASFAVLSDKLVEQFASSRDVEKTSDSLYKILQHQAEPLRGYIARFNQEKVKWEEDVATRAKAQCKQDPKTIRPHRPERDEKPSHRPARDSGNRNHVRYQNRPIEKAEGMEMSTWPDIYHLSVSRLELINVLRHMGQ
ncbi:hypothetical protein F2Q69_00022704 [Brassica cretica]|uniref:Retrotransposon gag domain-containing protein n=1 Tax=Brassica cretica TaxID=69181 RepID=A0A8S9QC03_BRACR|nr:hypothetical protein F2Q69_00022704 [Brassica cretica]